MLGRLGVTYLNFHAAGGVDMLRAGVEGIAEGARDARTRRAGSDRGHGAHERPRHVGVRRALADAIASGLRRCRVLGAGDRARARRASDFVTIVPGVRLADGDVDDQARVGDTRRVSRGGRRRARHRPRGHAARAIRAPPRSALYDAVAARARQRD